MPRKQLPKPARRKGSDNWCIRPHVGGKLRCRSLRTGDYNEALRRVPGVYQALLDEYVGTGPKVDASALPKAADSAPQISLEAVCASYREYLLECEQGARQEAAQAGVDDPLKTATAIRKRLDRMLKDARAKAIAYEFEHQRWWLTWLRNKGIGDLAPTTGHLLAMARTGVATLLEIIDTDSGIVPVVAAATVTKGTGDKLSTVLDSYLKARPNLSTDNALSLQSLIRDVIEIIGDKPITDYTRADGKTVREAFAGLPANRSKRSKLRGLSIADTIKRGEELGYPPQSPVTIRTKRANVARVFDFASASFDGVYNPFENNEAWKAITAGDEAAANQKDAFQTDELKVVLTPGVLPEYLWWLTWLGVCTGARSNEMCQLTTELVRLEPAPHLYFAPWLKLKRKASVRSVPIHQKLIDLGFLDFATHMNGRLFPSVPLRERTGRFSDAPGKDFARRIKALGIGRDGLSFHSLRHTFAAEWKRRHPLDNENRLRILGQAVAGVAGRYGDGYVGEANDMVLLEARAKLVEALRFNI